MSDTPHVSRRQFIETTAATASAALLARQSFAAISAADDAAFTSDFANTSDRVWIGAAYWSNPMEDWRIAEGRLECLSRANNRNVHLLTHQLSKAAEPFAMSVRLGMIETGKNGAAGFRFGAHDELNDYRGNCFFGGGHNVVVKADRTLSMAGRTAKLDDKADLKDITLQLTVKPAGDHHEAALVALNAAGDTVGTLTATFRQPPENIYGNLALVNNLPGANNGARCWFKNWTVAGPKVDHHPDRKFGPILWAMHTLSDNRDADGFVLKMTAQLPPMGKGDPQHVTLSVQRDGQWVKLAQQEIEPDSCTAIFRIAKWNEKVDTPYRLDYGDASYTGTVRKNPADKPLTVGNLTCQFSRGFPYGPVAENLAVADPDMLYFSGDQIYEGNGGYGIIREPADRAILNYLRKWYMFGWAFGDMMRDRPTVCLPDDHDVFHGNLWGEKGKALEGKTTSSYGGYIEPVRMVNAVHRTNCGHHPDLYDPTPILRDVSVYYGDMVYGRVSFAIIADRQFKSGPEHVDTGEGRADWVEDPNFDVTKLDKPGLVLLGERQHKFLDHWVEDWRGADMKVLLSETVFANAATHHGDYNHYLLADLDSGGWPQTQRDRIIRAVRRAFPIHLNGDQHLTTMLQHGVDVPREGFWSFSAPAICSIYQRWWRTDELKRPYTDRPAHNIPNTGQYRDGFGNLIYMYALGNPPGTGKGTPNRYAWAEDRGGGFGLLRVDRDKRTYTCESYRFMIDLKKPGPNMQYPGFPHTIKQTDNLGLSITGRLPKIKYDAIANPVLKVYTADGDLVYAIRLTENEVEPWVYADGEYTVKLGDPEKDQWTTRSGLKPHKS
ncbi:twin-arginine translocation pathway signal [Planctomycetales bacterium ZRK34]|nr:twin-arginine translocation pathway signal [Planctomycetales bacterium ZRK34]